MKTGAASEMSAVPLPSSGEARLAWWAEPTSQRRLGSFARQATQMFFCAVLLGTASPALSLSEQQLTEISDLCARPHESLLHVSTTFEDAGWDRLDQSQYPGVLTNLAVLQVVNRARNHYTLGFLRGGSDLDPNAPDKEVLRWVFEDQSALYRTFEELQNEQAEIYASPLGHLVVVRVTFEGEGNSGWHQICDVLSARSDLASTALLETLANGDTLSNSEDDLRSVVRYELQSHSLHPYAATPKASAHMFDLHQINAVSPIEQLADVWLQIRLSIPTPTNRRNEVQQ